MCFASDMGVTVFFGGTFNPPHIAHKQMLMAAESIAEVERIIVVPTNIPPHKDFKGYVAKGEHRLNMCKIMCKDSKKSVVSDMELNRGGRSYSFDTLKELSKDYDELYILIGGDMITTFDTWYKYEEVIKIAGILAVRRPDVDNSEFDKAVKFLMGKGAKIIEVYAQTKNVSSTEIRDTALIGNGEVMNSMLPEGVYEYIKENGLYPKNDK